MILFKAIKKAIAELKQDKKILELTKKLHKAELNYALLQDIVNEVSNKNVEIEICFEGMNRMIIKPKKMDEINFTSFKDKYEQYRR